MKLFIRCLLSQIYILMIVMLFACNAGNLGTTNSNLSSSTVTLSAQKITINNIGTVPVFADTATSSILYIHNNSNEVISNIDYSISDNLGINGFSIDVNGCNTIAANSRCALKFTTPVLSGTNVQGSAILTASYNGNSFSQIINYSEILDNSAPGIIVNSGVTINNYGNQSGYAMLYAYSGAGKSYLLKSIETNAPQVNIIDNFIEKNVQINEIVPIEISSSSANNLSVKLTVNSTYQANIYSNNVNIAVLPSSNGAILISGMSPIINTKVSLVGSFPIINAGNMMATLDTVTYPEGVESANGPNSCGTTLEPYASCNIYFKVPYYGGNGNINIPYNRISLTQAIAWYNPGGTGALLAMSSSSSQINVPYGTTILTITVIVKNIGAYPLNNVTPSSVTISGNANTTITNNLCNGTLNIESSCFFQVNITDPVIESNKQINLGFSGTYNNGTNQVYSRIVAIQYNSLPIWVWMSGESGGGQNPFYGIKGVASPFNNPGMRFGASSWIDNLGNLWLFGGSVGGGGLLKNDLWKYEILTNQWVWISGESTNNAIANYGIKHISSSINMPGARSFSAFWRDKFGNLLLFGGMGYGSNVQLGYLNDLWKYDIATNQWVWFGGESSINRPGNYGTKGVASVTNIMGARWDSAFSLDGAGNLWLFGGYGYASNNVQGYLNDLWKYIESINQWVWVSGANIVNQVPSYESKGIASPTNVIGGRFYPAIWIDKNQNIWIFGGSGLVAANTLGLLNDLWKYIESTNQWIWVSGTNAINQTGIYGDKDTPSPINNPGGRLVNAFWVDKSGDFLMLGGSGYGSSPTFGYLNDLWKYIESTNQWVWISGIMNINQPGVYGVKGMNDISNNPGSRIGSSFWIDQSGNLLLFGGNSILESQQLIRYSDLWKYSYY